MKRFLLCILVLVTILLLPLPAFAQAKNGKNRPPNIVFILADDLGINDLGCYGRKEHHTPNLDRLAAQGLRFTCAYCAQPICSPTRAAIVTGKSPARLHLTTFLPGRPNTPAQKLLHPQIQMQLPLDEVTIAELLKQLGYVTACIGKWHLGGQGFLPQNQGFDFVHTGQALTKPSDTEGGKGEYDLTSQAEKFIEANKDRPFFLHLCHNNPHIVLNARPELIERYKNTFNPTYAAMMHTLDDAVGRILTKLDELNLTEDTIVIFTSDNGGLHVLETPDSPATHNTPFRAGKGFLYQGGLRIPLIVRWPGHIPAGKTTDIPVISTDWAPTFMDICGAKTKRAFDGISIWPLLKGGEIKDRPLMWHFPHYTNQGSRPSGAIREGDWVLIEQYEDKSLELFNLANDPSETKNLATKESERARDMQTKLAAWRKQVGAQENALNPGFDPALHKKLYIDVDVAQLKAGPSAAAMRPANQEWRAGMNAVLPKKKGKE